MNFEHQHNPLIGVVAVPTTPFGPNGGIDEKAYQRVIRRLVDAGITTETLHGLRDVHKPPPIRNLKPEMFSKTLHRDLMPQGALLPQPRILSLRLSRRNGNATPLHGATMR